MKHASRRMTRAALRVGVLLVAGTASFCSVAHAEQAQPATASSESAASQPEETQAEETQPEEKHAPVANVLALSFAVQGPLNFDKDLPLGGGLTYTREYFVSSRTALGIHAGARVFPGTPFHFALGYGLTIKHYFGDWGNAGPGSGFYLLYGLLLQMNWLEDSNGVATGHDSRFGVGFDFRTEHVFPVVELGYHLTELRAFDRDTIWWPYTELLVGLRF